jgi:hypothetical protein
MPELCYAQTSVPRSAEFHHRRFAVVVGVVAAVVGSFAPGAKPLSDAVKVTAINYAAVDATTTNPPPCRIMIRASK